MLVGQRRFEPLLHQSLAGPGNGVDGGIQRTGNLAVAPALAGLGDIGLQQNTRLHQLTCTVFAGTDQCVELLPLLGAEIHDVLLYGHLLRGHVLSPVVPETSIQSLTPESRTQGTSFFCGVTPDSPMG
jgi:hypothetical protein